MWQYVTAIPSAYHSIILSFLLSIILTFFIMCIGWYLVYAASTVTWHTYWRKESNTSAYINTTWNINMYPGLYQCVGSVSGASASQPGGRGFEPRPRHTKILKDWRCCYLVLRSTIRDRATSIWRCSVAAGLTINWAKRISIFGLIKFGVDFKRLLLLL